MRSLLPRFPGLALSLAICAQALASEPAIVTKARAYLGTEEALNAIRSVHYTGTVLTTDPADPSRKNRATIEIIVQKPDQQRVVASSERGTETTVVDGYEGWQLLQDPADPKKQRLVVLKPEAVRRLRAQAWENLYFFRGLEKQGGRLIDLGQTTIDGVPCQKIVFAHTPNITFTRYFSLATGQLVQTDTDDGGSSREEGEQVVNGVRFPKSMKMTVKGAKGQTQLVAITLDTVKVNETFPAELFRMPSPTAP